MAWPHVLILASVLAGLSSDDDPSKNSSPPSSTTDQKASSESPADDKDRKDEKADEKADSGKSEKAAKSSKKPPSARPKRTPGPRVLTRSEMKKRSPFLSPPGSEGMTLDRYGNGDPIDWSKIPEWRRGSFFGIRAAGRFFVYVIDCSESMIDEDRFARAVIEVRRSVLALRSPQQFEVIFYNEDAHPMPGGLQPHAADSPNKRRLMSWLRLVEPDGGTDPRAALRQAVALRPEAIFLLSDGEFPDGTTQFVSRLNIHRIPIHCVDLSGGESGEHLRKIARESGGRYAARTANLQGKR